MNETIRVRACVRREQSNESKANEIETIKFNKMKFEMKAFVGNLQR